MIKPLHTSSANDTAIRVRGLSKAYTIQKGGLEKQSTLAESALARLKNPLRRARTETFHALKDIDLDIKKGEVVGIIGRNGAGKSTLLKVLSRITYPTTGEIDLFGRVGSLLEVGTGFHPELTGRENIYLNGAILGMARSEIKTQFDAIVDFAGVEKFLDTPVKRYSSGMYVRLAFAVAAHLRTEILIVDEVLAVGDQEFQKKCLGKMQDISNKDGRAILFVSHNMAIINNLCNRAVLLNHGKVNYIGSIHEATEKYLLERNVTHAKHDKTQQISDLTLLSKNIATNNVLVGESLQARIGLNLGIEAKNIEIGIIFKDQFGDRIAAIQSRYNSGLVIHSSSISLVSCDMPKIMLVPGVYDLEVVLGDGVTVIERRDFLQYIEVVGADIFGTGFIPSRQQGKVIMKAEWSCNL